ncbi:MAG TPA: ribulose-phosphate 3-epimerase [Chloroflexota bacterium]
MGVKIAPSVLSADFRRLEQEVAAAEEAGADLVHVDVMDGHFVPNISMGPDVVAAIRASTRLPLDVHLMIAAPERYLERFARAGADILTVHQETCPHLAHTVAAVRDLGVRAGVAVCPATPLAAVEEVVGEIDLLLIMTVNPGFGGQTLIPWTVDKVRRARRLLGERGSRALLEVDGGVNPATAPDLVAAGADVLVAGSAVYNQRATVAENLAALRAAVSVRLS